MSSRVCFQEFDSFVLPLSHQSFVSVSPAAGRWLQAVHGWLSSGTRTNLAFLKQSAKLLSDTNQSDSHIKADLPGMGTHALFCTNGTKGESKCPKSSADQGCSDPVAGEAVSCPQSWDSPSLRGAEGMWGQESFCEQEVTLSVGARLSPSLSALKASGHRCVPWMGCTGL